MDDDVKEDHTLLEDEYSDSEGGGRVQKPKASRCSRLYGLLRGCLIFASLSLNIVLLANRGGQPARVGTSTRVSYSGIPYDVPTVYQGDSEWSSTNESLADQYWESLDTSHVVVAISDTEAQQMGLDLSTRFPWDDSKGIYHVKAFHQTHCLRNLRRAYLDLYYGRKESVSYPHFMHCLNSIRQDVMCAADDTPMPSANEKHKIGDGQVLQCRNWEQLIRWTQAPERHSCFHMIDDYRPVPKTLEQFDACPPDSPYAQVAADYFREWGHHDPFDDQ